jgi:hypothetical protein
VQTESRYRNARASVILHAARGALIREVVALWAERCQQYNKAYWDALHDLILTVVSEACEGMDEVADIARYAERPQS